MRSAIEMDGYSIVDNLIDPALIPDLHIAFDELFQGRFETGVAPDEVNWQVATGDPTVTRQICNGWRANRTIARVILNEQLGRMLAEVAGWSGVRLMQDNVLWKPADAKALGFHQDSAYTTWFDPGDVFTCWIALDDTTADGGTVEFVQGSHRWALNPPSGQFHAPDNYRQSMEQAARQEGVVPLVTPVEVPAGGGSFHHGRTWHGSGENRTNRHRRALVLHAMPVDAFYVPDKLAEGTGLIYGRYKKLTDNSLDENYFPILWSADGRRTAAIDSYLNHC